MIVELSSKQRAHQTDFRKFVKQEIAPFAAEHDRTERIRQELISKVAEKGYLGATLPKDCGGSSMDMISYGVLHEEIAKSCSAISNLLTVHAMVGSAISKWGTAGQRESWLPLLARGEIIGAFALTEPEFGSDAAGVQTTAVLSEGSYILNGKKKWITFGQIADIFLVIGKCEGEATAFLVERDRLGFSNKPIIGLLGMRGSMLAELEFKECRIPKENLLGRRGFGLSSVGQTALGLGRYCMAWHGVGIAQACLESSLEYASQRKQFGVALREHQLIKEMLTDMISTTDAARLLCYQAGYFKDKSDPSEIMHTLTAKYFSARTAMKCATNAVQIHGANGCSNEYPVERYLRDAKILEIIEGSTQIQQIMISQSVFTSWITEDNRMSVANSY